MDKHADFEYKKGNILTEDVEALVNAVNCVGIMGRGIALQFKNAFPENCTAYKNFCRKGLLRPGIMFTFETKQSSNPRYIINFPTKRHWLNDSYMKDIDTGLVALRGVIIEKNIHSIAIPPLGCGLGGLDWSEVRPRIEKTLCGIYNLHVTIFEPN